MYKTEDILTSTLKGLQQAYTDKANEDYKRRKQRERRYKKKHGTRKH